MLMYRMKSYGKHQECGINTTIKGSQDGFELSLMGLHYNGTHRGRPSACLSYHNTWDSPSAWQVFVKGMPK